MSEPTEATPAKKPRLAVLLATGFGLGYLPVAPGTWGSLGGVALGWFLIKFSPGIEFVITRPGMRPFLPSSLTLGTLMQLPFMFGTVLISIVGVWASREAAKYFRKSDPGQIVVDEISGQMISYLPVLSSAFAGGGWKYLLLGFVLFRVFDIVKPWPARAAEKWPGGWGIMADDWLAGIYAGLILWLVHYLRWLG